MALVGVSIHSSNNDYPEPLHPPSPPCASQESLIRSKMEGQSSFGLSEEPVPWLQFPPNAYCWLVITASNNHSFIQPLFFECLLYAKYWATYCASKVQWLPSRSLLPIPFSPGSRRQGCWPELQSGAQGATSGCMYTVLQHVTPLSTQELENYYF